jgi:hypothetical protein
MDKELLKKWAPAFFIAAGILTIVMGNLTTGALYVVLGVVYMFLSKAKVVPLTEEMTNKVLDDEEFKAFIEADENIKAIKRCRDISACSLEEAINLVNDNMKEL